MDDEDIIHWQKLIEEHKRFRRIREEQAVGYGKLACPPHILLEIEDATKQIGELEQRIQRRIRNAENGTFFSAEQVDEISEKIAKVAEIQKVIPIQEGTIKALKETFYRKHQSIKTKLFMGLLFIVAILPFVRIILDVISSTASIWAKIILVLATLAISAILAFWLWRWAQTQLYSNIRDMEKSLQANIEELEQRKAELSKIYKVSE